MRNTLIIGTILIIALLASSGIAKEKMQIPERTAQQKLNSAVWQMDLHICTAIAYAKSLDKTAEEYGKFVGEQVLPNWAGRKGQGFAPVMQALSVRWEIYRKGEFEVVSETETSVTIRMNRPYANYFYNGDLYGVTLKEYEAFFEQMAIAMIDYLGMKYEQAVEGEHLIVSLTLKK